MQIVLKLNYRDELLVNVLSIVVMKQTFYFMDIHIPRKRNVCSMNPDSTIKFYKIIKEMYPQTRHNRNKHFDYSTRTSHNITTSIQFESL